MTRDNVSQRFLDDVMGEMENVNEYLSIPAGVSWDESKADPVADIDDLSNSIMGDGYIEKEPKICAHCFFCSEETSIFMCPYCGHIESTRGALGYRRRFLNERLLALGLNLAMTKYYQLPRFTFRDHLRDCFGWLI